MQQSLRSGLEVTGLGVSVPGRRLVEALHFAARPGEFVALLGQNGSGKTLTLLTLAGLRAADCGRVTLDGHDVHTSPRRLTAKIMALLPQHSDDLFPVSVLETALIGRHPHIGRFRWESAQDTEVALASLKEMDIADMAGRNVMTLSGGERRRLAIAQVLTQQPSVFLLDEPTNHLDPQHQVDVLRVFRDRARQGATVIASLHDANLATRYADRCLLLYGDGHWDLGATRDVLDAERLSRLYATPFEAVPWRAGMLFIAAAAEKPD